MSILLSLSARHLRLNRKRTLITIIGIALSVAMITAISGFIVSFQDVLYQDAVNRDGLWHVRYFGLDAQTAEAAAADPTFSQADIAEGEDGLEVRLQFVKLDRHLYDRSEAVCMRLGIGQEQVQYHNNLLIAKGIIPAGYYESLYAFAAVLLSLVAVASVMVISNAFSISASERSRQFGLLKSIGATGRQVRRIVLWEGLLLALFAIPLGFLAGLAAQWTALSIANSVLKNTSGYNMQGEFRVVLSLWVLLLAVVAALITILLAAWMPARRAARLSAIDAIRQTAEVRIRPRDVRVSPLTAKLFGFEGLLAAKTMRRNRRRYRTTVLSLSVSIVLFIAVSSFGDMLFKASSMFYEDYGTNVLVQITSEDTALQQRLGDSLAAMEGAEAAYPFRALEGSVEIPSDWMSDMGNEMLGAGTKNANIYTLSDETFAALCRKLYLDPAQLASPEQPGAILVNTTGTYISRGRRYNFTPYQPLSGEQIAVTVWGEQRLVAVTGETEEIPTELMLFFSANALNLIVPESVRAAWQPEGTPSMLQICLMADDPEAYVELAQAALSAGKLREDAFFISNYEKVVENSRKIARLLMVFIYGFIAMLSLISVTNVITTISTGIALRRREFAMLRSMGMTSRDISRSLRFESLIYGLKSLLWGIPLGILASFGMYHALGGAMTFAYIWPVRSILLSIVAVLLLTGVTMAFASKRQRREHIADVLQTELA